MLLCSDGEKKDRLQCAVYSLLTLHHTLAAVPAAVNQQSGVKYQQFLKVVEKNNLPAK